MKKNDFSRLWHIIDFFKEFLLLSSEDGACPPFLSRPKSLLSGFHCFGNNFYNLLELKGDKKAGEVLIVRGFLHLKFPKVFRFQILNDRF